MTRVARTIEKRGSQDRATETAHRTPNRQAERSASRTLGNFLTQDLLNRGALRAKLAVGSPNDPAEAEADRMADAAMSGKPAGCTCGPGEPPCPACRSTETIRRKPRHHDAPPSGADSLSLGTGRGLDMRERGFFESRYLTDLSDVRIHDNPEAGASAAQLNARAFSLGPRIAFAAGEYRPHTSDGRRLLGHELAHVVQGHSGIRRQPAEPNMTPVDANQSTIPPPEAAMSSIHDPVQVQHAADFNPCTVNVASLANYDLLAEYSNALGVINRGRSAPGYFDYRNLQRRLAAERDRRVDLGHAWLATMPGAIPEVLYRIVDTGSGAFQVLAVPGGAFAGAPENMASAPLMTRAQFDRFLETHDIERLSADEYRMRMASVPQSAALGATITAGGLYNRPADLMRMLGGQPLSPAEALPFVREGALPSPFDQPEWFLRQPQYMQTDLLHNPPALDPARSEQMAGMLRSYRAAPGVPQRIDVLGAVGEPVQGGTVAVAQTDIPSLGNRNFPGASSEALPAQLRGTAGTTGGSVLVAANPTAVNHAEHVALENLRLAIEESIRRGTLTREGLRGRTVFVVVEQEPCSSCAAGAGEGRSGVLQQFAELYPELTVEVRNARTSRSYIYRNGQLLNPSSGVIPIEALAPTAEPGYRPPLTPAELAASGTPELQRSQQLGGFRAARGATLQGAGLGGVIAVATSGGIILWDVAHNRPHAQWGQELAVSGGVGAAGGGAGALTEQLLISGLNRSVSVGRLGGGAVGAMFIEGISMGLLEQREHSGLEVGTRLGRSGALGAGSVWAGAAIGTAVGGPIGFVVGLAVGGALYYIGDKLVPGGREDWDAIEAGCTPLPSITRLTAPPIRPNSPIFACFEANTPVTLADGSTRHIAEIAIGDMVLSYHERDKTLQASHVTAVHEAAPDLMLELRFAHGGSIQLTGAHKLRGPRGWRAAAELRPGDELWFIKNASSSAALVCCHLDAVLEVAPNGSVYDLSVEGTHTYFAGGVLAHNKLP